MSENNDASIESNCFRGGFTLKASRLGGAVLRPAVLGPSVLGATQNSSTSSLAGNRNAEDEKPTNDCDDGIVNNPFLREQKGEDDDVPAEVVAEAPKDDEEVDERPDPLVLLRNNGMERANMFAATRNIMPRVESSGFVFGQNVHERVVGENVNAESNVAQGSGSSDKDKEAATPQLLFSSVIQKAAESTENNEDAPKQQQQQQQKSLNEVAREYEESRAQKRKYEEVETFTGEENEINIVDVSCKLFAFVNSNWEERGRGSLRLNDLKDERDCSRVVFRTAGNLRLLLNTKVWAAMVAELASPRSLRLTAIDSTGTVRIFLAMGRHSDISVLHKALGERIAKRKQTHPEECAPPDTKNGVCESKPTSIDSASSPHIISTTTTTISTTTHDVDDNEDEDDDDDNNDDDVDNANQKPTAPSTDEPSPKKSLLLTDNKSSDAPDDKPESEAEPAPSEESAKN